MDHQRNHVGLHHTDNKPGANLWSHGSGPSLVDTTAKDTLTFNAKAIDRLDDLIHQLRK